MGHFNVLAITIKYCVGTMVVSMVITKFIYHGIYVEC